MAIVIDAHIIRDYYLEDTGEQSNATADVAPIINGLSEEDAAFIDETGIIKHKWRRNVSDEWFWDWYPRALQQDRIQIIEAQNPISVRNSLARDCRFPIQQDRKIWYIRTSEAVTNEVGGCTLLSEDLHFYEPREVGCNSNRKNQILLNRQGRVVVLLSNINISVHCAATCC